MIEFPAGLGDDSEDFSDGEVDLAVVLPSLDRVIAHLRELRCPQCKQGMAAIEHARRRRAHLTYWRMRMQCAEQHDSVLVVIRADWLQQDGDVVL